jgi:hypothetical protein
MSVSSLRFNRSHSIGRSPERSPERSHGIGGSSSALRQGSPGIGPSSTALRQSIDQQVRSRMPSWMSQMSQDSFSPSRARPPVDLSGGLGSGGLGSGGLSTPSPTQQVDGTNGVSPATPRAVPPVGGVEETTTPSTGERYDVPYINQMSSDGWEDDWNASSNCGPTTMAMIAKGFGLGQGTSDGAMVNQLANSIGMGSEGVGYTGMQAMGEQLGLSSEVNAGSDVDWIRQQLEQGNMVAANGDRSVTLQNEDTPYASGSMGGGHWIAVTGMTPEGNFIVKDPSTTCRELTPDELSRFLATNDHGGYSVSYRPPA